MFNSDGRSAGDYFLFALGALCFLLFVWGIIVALPLMAFFGCAVLALTVWSFRNREAPR